jgi:hypothetical protein
MGAEIQTKVREYLKRFTKFLFSYPSKLTHFSNNLIKKAVYSALIFIFSLNFINGQTAGDLAFIGWNSDGNDDLVFILMADFSANTVVYFRDDEYNNGWDGIGEGTISWTVPSGGLTGGTMIEINNASNASPTVNTGTVTREDAGFNIANSENAVYAYTSTSTFNAGTFTFLGGFCNATSTSELTGTNLTDDTDFWSWGNKDNWKYTGSTSTSTTNEMKTNLQNASNWTNADGSGNQSYDFTFSDFSLPVELSYFKAVFVKNKVQLLWRTESEIENLGFILERQSLGSTTNHLTSEENKWKEISSYITHTELQGQGSVSYPTDYNYFDEDVTIGKTYSYRLVDVDHHGVKTIHPERSVFISSSSIILHKPFPNPFNPSTSFTVFFHEKSSISIKIIDSLGREINSLAQDKIFEMGPHQFHWNGKTKSGDLVSSGTYFIRIESGETILSEKLFLIR